MDMPADYDHLLHHAQRLFPGVRIAITYDLEADMISLAVDDRRFTFEVGSDDDAYVFVAGDDAFEIPLMEILPHDRDCA
jgi:hypothetical protein